MKSSEMRLLLNMSVY